jgi:hypothetical protein
MWTGRAYAPSHVPIALQGVAGIRNRSVKKLILVLCYLQYSNLRNKIVFAIKKTEACVCVADACV